MQFIVHMNCKMQISNTHTTKEDTLSEAELQQVWTKIVNYDLKKGNINREQRSAMVERDWTAVDELFEGCIISSYKPSLGSGSELGVPVMSYKGTNFRPHRIACKIGPFSRIYPKTQDKYEASHRCHCSLCYNPFHLVYESSKVNRSRYCCELFGHKDGYNCPHEPVCTNCTSI